jgi:uncharacterized protein YkwD
MVARRFFAHVTPEGIDPGARLAAAGWSGTMWAENIAWGSGSLGTPAEIVKGWMNSPGHRANILNGALRTSGIGVAAGTPAGDATGGTYTQDFGG